jgi:hypothetical protein
MTRFNPFRHFQALIAAVSWTPLLLFGGELSITLTPAHAQPNLPQPRIFNELPPPSPSISPPSVPTFNVPTSPSTPSSAPTFNAPTSPSLPSSSTIPDDAPAGREYNFQAPPSPSTRSRRFSATSNLYRVDIFGDNPSLLSQVQQIEPTAFVRREGVIQAGIFSNETNARSRVRELSALGIRSQITPLAPGTDGALVSSERFASERFVSDSRQDSFNVGGYFVVIPGNSKDLPDIAARVVSLGVAESAVSQRESPRGSHIAVGPFDNRRDADRWSNYFRSTGMDARVYFAR